MKNPSSPEGKDKGKGLAWNLIDAFAKIGIPLAVAWLAWVQNQTLVTLQTRMKAEDVDLRFVELAWNSLVSGDPDKLNRTMELIETLRPDLRLKLAQALAFDTRQPDTVRQRAERLVNQTALQLLSTYKVDIYFDESSHADIALANRIKHFLESRGLVAKVVLAPRPASFAFTIVKPEGPELRYDVGTETVPAQTMADMLKTSEPPVLLGLQPVFTSTPGTLSVVLFSRGS